MNLKAPILSELQKCSRTEKKLKKLYKTILLAIAALMVLTGCNNYDLKPTIEEVFTAPGSIVTISTTPGQAAIYPKVDFFLVAEDTTLEPLECSHYDQKQRVCNSPDGKVLLEFDHSTYKGSSSISNVYKTTLGDRKLMDCWRPDHSAYLCMERNYVFNYEEDKKLAIENSK